MATVYKDQIINGATGEIISDEGAQTVILGEGDTYRTKELLVLIRKK